MRLVHIYPTVPTNPGSSTAPVIAPGAESIGQAQILSSFSKPFELEGFFGAADAGAFGAATGDVQMDADEEGDVFFDAVEGDAMDEDGCVLLFLYFFKT